ncbi:MAG: hypothetical protein JWM95_3737 [Gemmatimonadetes bacterium]|nr:hypothetical protein [Gemmatimonadota bacterium]
MRAYDIGIASLAIEAPAKWTDNVLSQHTVPGVMSSKQGVARRLTHSAIICLALVRHLQREVGMSVAAALRVASDLATSGTHQSGVITLTLDIAALEQQLDARLTQALESAPTPRRGRPPTRT